MPTTCSSIDELDDPFFHSRARRLHPEYLPRGNGEESADQDSDDVVDDESGSVTTEHADADQDSDDVVDDESDSVTATRGTVTRVVNTALHPSSEHAVGQCVENAMIRSSIIPTAGVATAGVATVFLPNEREPSSSATGDNFDLVDRVSAEDDSVRATAGVATAGVATVFLPNERESASSATGDNFDLADSVNTEADRIRSTGNLRRQKLAPQRRKASGFQLPVYLSGESKDKMPVVRAPSTATSISNLVNGIMRALTPDETKPFIECLPGGHPSESPLVYDLKTINFPGKKDAPWIPVVVSIMRLVIFPLMRQVVTPTDKVSGVSFCVEIPHNDDDNGLGPDCRGDRFVYVVEGGTLRGFSEYLEPPGSGKRAIFGYTEEDAEAAVQMDGGLPRNDYSVKAHETIQQKVSQLQDTEGTELVYSFSVTRTSNQGAHRPECSTSNGDNQGVLNDAVAKFIPANPKTLFRRMLEGDETVAESFWTCFYSLPFTLRAILAGDNPHRKGFKLPYVKGGRAKGSPIVSFEGTAQRFREFLVERLTDGTVLLGGLNTCSALKRSGCTPPRGVQPSPKRTRVVRNVHGTAYRHRNGTRLFGLRSDEEGQGLGVKFVGRSYTSERVAEYAGLYFYVDPDKGQLACVESVSEIPLDDPSRRRFTCHYVVTNTGEKSIWNGSSRFSLERAELEPLLFNSVKSFPGKIGLRVSKQFDANCWYNGTVVCARRGDVGTGEDDVWWTVAYDDGDIGEVTDSELELILQAPADQPRLPFMYSVDTFVISQDVATTKNSSKSRGWRLVTREIGGGGGGQVICVEKNCEATNDSSTCDHVQLVKRAFPLPPSWDPGTLECEVPRQQNGINIAGDIFRDVCPVHLLSADWGGGQPPTEHVPPPDFNVDGKFHIVAAVLSDVEGTFRIVKVRRERSGGVITYTCQQRSHQGNNRKRVAANRAQGYATDVAMWCGHVTTIQLWMKATVPEIGREAAHFESSHNQQLPVDSLLQDGYVEYGKPGYGTLYPGRYYFPALTQSQMPMEPTRFSRLLTRSRNQTEDGGVLPEILYPGAQQCFRATNRDPAYCRPGAPCGCRPHEILCLSELIESNGDGGWVQVVFQDPSRPVADTDVLYYPAEISVDEAVNDVWTVNLHLPDVEEPSSSLLGQQLIQVVPAGFSPQADSSSVVNSRLVCLEQDRVVVRVHCATAGQRVPPFNRDGTVVRFFRYGFVPDARFRVTKESNTTRELGALGRYIRRYFNTTCMGRDPQHLLEYDGAEYGIFRLNGALSAGREIGDVYADQLVSHSCTDKSLGRLFTTLHKSCHVAAGDGSTSTTDPHVSPWIAGQIGLAQASVVFQDPELKPGCPLCLHLPTHLSCDGSQICMQARRQSSRGVSLRQARDDYRFLLCELPTFPARDGGSPEEVCYNAAARRVLKHLGTTLGVIYEGRLGSDRKGRLEYENQAGDRSVVLWTRRTPPTQVFLEALSFQERSCLFVVPGDSVENSITDAWDVPVLSVTMHTFHEHLLPLVRTEFTEDSNAIPPVYIRLCGTGSMDTVQLVLSEKVIRHSFDVFATSSGCPENAGVKSFGLTGVVEGKIDSPHKGAIPITQARSFRFSLFKQDDVDLKLAGRTTDERPGDEQGEGGQGMMEEEEEGSDDMMEEEEEGSDDGVQHGAQFGMRTGQWSNFISLLQDDQPVYVSVRFAVPIGSVKDRTFLKTPLSGGTGAEGHTPNRLMAKREMWRLLEPYPATARQLEDPCEDNDQHSESSHAEEDDEELEVAASRDHRGVMSGKSKEHPVGANNTGVDENTSSFLLQHTILPCVPEKCRGLVDVAITQVIANHSTLECRVPYNTLRSVAELLRALCTNFSIVAILPLKAVELVRHLLEKPGAFLRCSTSKGELQELCPEVFAVIDGVLWCDDKHVSSVSWRSVVTKFLEGLCDEVLRWDACSIRPPAFEAIIGSDDVEQTGATFRFTQSGLQGRVTRRYVTNKESRTECNKKFSGSRGRTGGLFSFFCVLHSLCLGTAIIDDAEGRRDPFFAIYIYCLVAPETIAFDFGCGLCEYALNREPYLFRFCRFIIDKFHLLGHKLSSCSVGFAPYRKKELYQLNDSVCEQFHSFVVQGKSHFGSMGQLRFLFTVELFIKMWNKPKLANVRVLTAADYPTQLIAV